jgi:hypothetical protein
MFQETNEKACPNWNPRHFCIDLLVFRHYHQGTDRNNFIYRTEETRHTQTSQHTQNTAFVYLI